MALSGSITLAAPPLTWNLNGLEFDAWLRLNHNNSLTITQHPVETGASITDHSYVNPRRFAFDIGMTDSPIVANPPLFPGNATRSINAYQTIVELQRTRAFLTLTSKYGFFENILIESIDVPDGFQTKNTMRATINLVEVIVANTRLVQVSANPQATDQTKRGQTPPQSLSQLVTTAAKGVLDSLFRDD